MFDQNDDPAANDAIGLAITDLDFGMALFKPVAIADRSSYFALRGDRQRHRAGRRAGRDPERDQPARRGQQRERAGHGRRDARPRRLRRSSTSPPRIQLRQRRIHGRHGRRQYRRPQHGHPHHRCLGQRRASASTSTTTAPRKSSSPASSPSSSRSARTASQVIKIALTNLSLRARRSRPTRSFELSGLTGLFLITQQGMAASITLPGSARRSASSSGGFSVRRHADARRSTPRTPPVDETFLVGFDGSGNPITTRCRWTKGPFLRADGLPRASTVTHRRRLLAVQPERQLHLRADHAAGPTAGDTAGCRIGVARTCTANVLGVTLSDGQGGFVFMPTASPGSCASPSTAGDPGVAVARRRRDPADQQHRQGGQPDDHGRQHEHRHQVHRGRRQGRALRDPERHASRSRRSSS